MNDHVTCCAGSALTLSLMCFNCSLMWLPEMVRQMNSRGENPAQGQWYCQPAQLVLEEDVQIWPKGSKDTASIYCSVGSNDFGNVFSLNYLRIGTLSFVIYVYTRIEYFVAECGCYRPSTSSTKVELKEAKVDFPLCSAHSWLISTQVKVYMKVHVHICQV